MEEMSGVEALKELRADARFADTAIIMLTVDASRQVFREAIDLKADDYLVKPISNETLRERIEKCLS